MSQSSCSSASERGQITYHLNHIYPKKHERKSLKEMEDLIKTRSFRKVTTKEKPTASFRSRRFSRPTGKSENDLKRCSEKSKSRNKTAELGEERWTDECFDKGARGKRSGENERKFRSLRLQRTGRGGQEKRGCHGNGFDCES